jgi:hypothetical protein
MQCAAFLRQQREQRKKSSRVYSGAGILTAAAAAVASLQGVLQKLAVMQSGAGRKCAQAKVSQQRSSSSSTSLTPGAWSCSAAGIWPKMVASAHTKNAAKQQQQHHHHHHQQQQQQVVEG